MELLNEFKKQLKEGELFCEVDLAMRVIGGKWKSNILWFLHEDGVLRYGELKRKLGRVTPKMLTQQLRELEDCDMINRHLYHQVPPKVEYSLTDRGKSAVPLLQHMYEWSMESLLD